MIRSQSRQSRIMKTETYTSQMAERKKKRELDPFSIMSVEEYNLDQRPLSLHENLVNQYIQQTKLDSVLLLGIKSILSGDLLPKNPYYKLSRFLNVSCIQKEVVMNFEKSMKNFKKNVMQYQDKPFGIASIGDTITISGAPTILEWIDVARFEKLYAGIEHVIPDFNRKYPNCMIEITHSIGGGYLLKSDLIKYPDSAPRSLEIAAECFITAETIDVALDAFCAYVYNDIISLNNVNDLHIFKEFIIYKYDFSKRKSVKKSWEIKELISNKNKFMAELRMMTIQKVNMYMKLLLKTKVIDYQEIVEDLQEKKYKSPYDDKRISYFVAREMESKSQYFESYKIYNLHFNDSTKGEKESFEYQPLSSLLKRVFTNEGQARKYASYFYDQSEFVGDSKHMRMFIKNQLVEVYKRFRGQNILSTAWEFFPLANLIDQEDIKKNIMDNIIQFISSSFAKLMANVKINNVLRILINAYKNTSLNFFKSMSYTVFELYRLQLSDIVAEGVITDILRFRDYLFVKLKDMTDDETGLMSYKIENYRILNTLYRMTKVIAESNLNIASCSCSTLPDYIYESLKKNEFVFPTEKEPETYDSFNETKEPHLVLHLSAEIEENLQHNKNFSENKELRQADAENKMILLYISEYELFDNVYYFLRDIFFGNHLPNPLPTLNLRMEIMGLKYELFEIPKAQVLDVTFEEIDPTNKVYKGSQVMNDVYFHRTDQMKELHLPTLFGHSKVLFVISPHEIASLRNFLVNIDWRNSLSKNPPTSYQISDVMSVSTYSLFCSSTSLKRTYIEWNVSWDFVMRGPNFHNASQIFIDILVKYAYWMENKTEMIGVGFFTNFNKYTPFLDINTLVDNFETTKPRDMLLSVFSSKKRVYYKFLYKVDDRFKCINLWFNMHFVEASGTTVQNYCEDNSLEDFVKIFFKQEDIVLWEKLYPYQSQNVLKLIEKERRRQLFLGNINKAYKLSILKFVYEENNQMIAVMARPMFSLSEPLMNFAREADTFHALFSHLKNIEEKTQSVFKLKLKDFENFFEDFKSKLVLILKHYYNVYLEGIAANVVNFLQDISTFIVQKQTEDTDITYKSILGKLAKISEYCDFMSEALIYTFKELLELEYQIFILDKYET